jgi:hypothetical protein
MRSLSLSVTVLAFLVSIAVTANGQGPKDVNVINSASAPVPVRSVDEPAKRAFQLAFEINTPTPVTTPAGKIFVVEHVSGTVRMGTVSGSTQPCRFLQLGFPVSGTSGAPEALELIPTLMGTAASIGMDISFQSINHPMKFYIRPNMEIGGANFVLGGACTASPIIFSRMVFSGYLVDQN